MSHTATPTIKYHNRTKALLCYLLVWGLALLLPYVGLAYLYPYKLAGSAPLLTGTLTALPLPQAAQDALTATLSAGDLPSTALQAALDARDLLWRGVVAMVAVFCWAMALMVQLSWRVRYQRPRFAARATLRAIADYRWSMLAICGVQLAGAVALTLVGIRWIGGRTLWDYLIYYNSFVLTPLAAIACFRLAAPPAISGRHAFFKRL